MILMIDSVDALAEYDPSFMEFLQDFAKYCADMGALRIVFTQIGSAFPLLSHRSAWSLADCPFEIGEISDNKAVAFLEQRGVHWWGVYFLD